MNDDRFDKTMTIGDAEVTVRDVQGAITEYVENWVEGEMTFDNVDAVRMWDEIVVDMELYINAYHWTLRTTPGTE